MSRRARIGLQTWGTEGDVRPFFALGHALQKRGHEVRVVYTSVEGRDFGAGGFDRLADSDTASIRTRGILPGLRQKRQHRLDHLGMDPGRRIGIKVDHGLPSKWNRRKRQAAK